MKKRRSSIRSWADGGLIYLSEDKVRPPLVIVMSVKGGTGKSLISINLSIMLSKYLKVGCLDADVDSPNLPAMLGLNKLIEINDRHNFIPAEYNGIKIMSTGLFQEGIFTVCKTGKANKQIVQDMLRNTIWGDVDIIVVDSPAGSCDELRAIIESGYPFIGVVLVALPFMYDDCCRVIELCMRFGINIIGIIENMDGAIYEDGTPVINPTTGKPFAPLGDPQGERDIKELAKNSNIEYIGSIPMVDGMYNRCMSGMPEFPERVVGPIASITETIRLVV